MLWFRVFLEILNNMIWEYYKFLKTNKFEIAVAKPLINYFDTNLIKNPEGLFCLPLNKITKKAQEKAENIIETKVNKFVDDYIKGKVYVIIMPIKRE